MANQLTPTQLSEKVKSKECIYTNDTPVVQIDASTAFNGLTFEEQRYAHFISKASWFGSLIVLYQTSPESPLIFILFHRLFNVETIDSLKQLAINEAKFTEDEWKALLVYVSAFYTNMGNYRSYGDSKFIPHLPLEKLEKLVKSSKCYQMDQEFMNKVWENVKEPIYSLKLNELSLGFPPNGITTYWSKNMTEDDDKIVQKFLAENNIEAYNTRAFKDFKTGEYIIRFASVRSDSDPEDRDYMDKVKTLEIDGHKFRLERGDYSPILSMVNTYLEQAKTHALNDNEKMMIEKYIQHFYSGSLDQHKEGSRYWIKDKGPTVESYIGFIENYRDPAGQRAEFEGFVAIVNKEMSKKFSNLVENASKLLPLLPWCKELEKDKFLQPDFTSLDVLTFCQSCAPMGINIPNYDDIRQNEGFKNVSLGNVIQAAFKGSKRNFISKEDSELLDKYSEASFEIIVGLHELLGHGSGKILKANQDGTLNFDPQKTINPLTGKPVDKWYQFNETYDLIFGSISSPYEECRAECVGLYLSLNQDVLRIFGFTDPEEMKKLIYITWLEMVLKGIESLKMYNASVKKWLQAHSRARYVITRVLLEGAKDLVSIEHFDKSPVDGEPDLLIKFKNDYELIMTQGRKAIGDFLQKLQVYKSTGDIENAKKMFDYYSTVDDQLEYPYLQFREITVARKLPRRLYVQSATAINQADPSYNSVQLKSFDSTHEGLIYSFQEHFSNAPNLERTLLSLWEKDSAYF